ncbi:MAG: YtxH domain-containing protein [Thermomicrobiales bacterium]|nr:YtxH domain-containing protein [Thermomicrobiales bacterium]MCO5218353.1 YtxH domain-containing protein [Thermomicrobiales bacterium]MCO5227075.1 YtxH domain-containing protein [Thermomicrobiales bacterium]
MATALEDFRKQAKKYADELDLERIMDSIDFSRVDTSKLKQIDFSKGFESAKSQLEQLPKVRLTTQPQQVVVQEESDGFLPGLLLGVVLGAILALIFAPKSGQDTREQIVHKVEDLKGMVSGQTDDVIETIETTIEEAESALPDEPAIERNFGE